MQRDPLPAQSLATQYRAACAQTDRIFDCVLPEFLTSRPVRERHRLLFYIGHLEAFDSNLLAGRLIDDMPVNAELDRLFAFGIDPVGGGLPTDQPEDWPSLDRVYAYRDAVRARIDACIPDVNFSRNASSGAGDDDAATLIQVIIEHRQMHAETLAYLLHQMPIEQKRAPVERPLEPRNRATSRDQASLEAKDDAGEVPSRSRMVRVDAGDAVLGLTPDTQGTPRFGWDNEFGTRRVDVPAFWIDRRMVSNGDYLAFIEAGGYQHVAWWREEDWAWRLAEGVEHPAFWRREGDSWLLRTMFEEVPLPHDWPVYVSHAEASAYARFANKRLPTEAEWLRAASGAAAFDAPPEEGNFDFRAWDPTPVGAHPQNRSVFGVEGQFGNGWEWTADTFAPLPDFKAFSFYRGYSADFFDDRHFVMKGGSARTAARMLRPSFRNWFQPHYPYAYVGLRCVVDKDPDIDVGDGTIA